MSRESSSTPALAIEFCPSGQRRAAVGAFIAGGAFACLYSAWHWWPAAFFIIVLARAAVVLWPDPLAGRSLCWRRGIWGFGMQGQVAAPLRISQAITLGRLLLIRYELGVSAGSQSLVVFGDACTEAQLRQLRRHLRVNG